MADSETTRRGLYNFKNIEKKWQDFWEEHKTYEVSNPGDPDFDGTRPKCYVLDMFPYPSGAGLHVGHPLGYCATDIYCRFKRMNGFNVLHPMGFDAFGLPAEQYAIEHGVHPAVTTKKNIDNMRRQLKLFGFSYDWSREVSTCEPDYYRHTQWIFLQMFDHWFDESCEWNDDHGNSYKGRARSIDTLEMMLEMGQVAVDDGLKLVYDPENNPHREWTDLSDEEKKQAINNQRLAFIDEVDVNWCPALGTVLANEEVTAEGRSERGNHPVYRRPLRQWMLRITKYAERLLHDLEYVEWPEPIKLMQRNWIGRSTGAEVDFPIVSGGPEAPCVPDRESWFAGRKESGFPGKPEDYSIRVYTTRPDTLYGATYMVLAPEHPLVAKITTPDQKDAVEQYVTEVRHKSELERTAETKEKTGVFTGAYAMNPLNQQEIPIWVADYVMMGYGTGAIMAVPAHDTRDFEFAKVFDLPMISVVCPTVDWFTEQILNSAFDDEYCKRKGKPGLPKDLVDGAANAANIGDGFTAQTAASVIPSSWVEQVVIPIFIEDPGVFADSFTGNGLAINSRDFDGVATSEFKQKITSWLEDGGLGKGAVNYKLRDWVFSRQKYWGEPFPVLHGEDGEVVGVDEFSLPVELPPMDNFKPTPVGDNADAMPEPPLGRAKEWCTVEKGGKTYTRDLNTMPQWAGSCWYYLRYLSPRESHDIVHMMAEDYWMPVDVYVGGAEHAVLHLLYARFWHKFLFDISKVSGIEPFKKLINQGMIQAFAYRDSRGANVPVSDVEEAGAHEYRHKESGERVEQIVAKMSKSLKNVVNPEDILNEFGADTFRLYEMFMGPIEASKPWNTQDVPGLYKLVNRIWRLVVDENTGELSSQLTLDPPDKDTTRLLHKTIKGVTEDVEQFKFNTAIAKFFDFVNALTRLEKRPRACVEPFLLLVAPFMPHVAEELWEKLGNAASVALATWPAYDESLAKDDEVEIAVQVLGKIKARIQVPADAAEEQIEALAKQEAKVADALAGKTIRRVVVVKGRLVNFIAN